MSTKRMPRIAVFYRPGRNVEWQRKFTGQDIPDDAIEEATLHRDGIREAGYQAELVEWLTSDLATMAATVKDGGFDLVFNASSMQEVAFLEAAGMPFCGSGLDLVAIDKAVRKMLWAYQGVPTAPFAVIDKDELAGGHVVGLSALRSGAWQPQPPLDYPLFVKPVRGRGSSGISDDSIVEDHASLVRQAALIIERLDQGALVETFLQGREVTVGIIGGNPPLVLTPLEIEYNQARTNTYEHKMDNEIMHCPARLNAAGLAGVQDVALRAFAAVGARDYGRVDTIVDANGQANVLELNTFAGLQILTGNEAHLHASYIGTMAKAMGLTRSDVMGRIVAAARTRYDI
jgi:D-alanine-D-alanine ligase